MLPLELAVELCTILIGFTLYSAAGTLIVMINQRKMIAIDKNTFCSVSSAELLRMWGSV